jgi:FAD/FMN-containing dehydrogenase
MKLLETAGVLREAPSSRRGGAPQGVAVNDVQSQLNETRVFRVETPRSIDDLQIVLHKTRRQNRTVSVAGGRHAMGGQQFGSDAILLDTTAFNQVVRFDRAKGQITVEAGIQWPELIEYLHAAQAGQPASWAIREKQTGVDRVSIGGSLASNIHGRGLRSPPLVCDIESFTLLTADGRLHTCSRGQNQELFSLAIGGYGLFGVVAHVTLRLVPRTKVQRIVEVLSVKDLLPSVDRRLAAGFLYGDCQYSTDLDWEAERHPGVFSCYRPVPGETPIPPDQKALGPRDWIEFYTLARTDKKQAFERYSKYYLSTNDQVYWSDTHQLAGSFDAHRTAVNKQLGTQMITEAYVAPEKFLPFMAAVRQDYIDHQVDMTYGTIRFIEKDSETFLPWAKERSVCIVCNLNVVHTDVGKQKAAEDFRRIIDRAIEFGGRYYLTYHRWATRKQVETCYPQFVDFLRLKKKYDPQERFQSDWYRHYKTMFSDRL